MSNAIRFGAFNWRPKPTVPMTPPAGPEKKVFTGILRTAPGDTAPPLDCITRGLLGIPSAATPASNCDMVRSMIGIRLAFTVAVENRSNSRNSPSTSLEVHK